MRARGIDHDTGFLPGGRLTRTFFDPAVVAQEPRCTAARISGGLPERLSVAGEPAAAGGEVALVLGCELSLFASGFMPGGTFSSGSRRCAPEDSRGRD